MAKTIVISGADYASHAFATVTLSGGTVEQIECTGLTLSSSTIEIDGINATQVLTASREPSDCNQAITWSSSDSSVVTVTNGTITAHKIGSATITATCGDYSAECAVSVVHTMQLDWLLGYYLGNQSSSPLINKTSSSNSSAFASSDTDVGGYNKRIYDYNNLVSAYRYPYVIPDGAVNAVVTTQSDCTVTFIWTDVTRNSSNGSNIVLTVDYSDTSAWNNSIPKGDRTVVIPTVDGISGFNISLYTRNNNITETTLANTTLKFTD